MSAKKPDLPPPSLPHELAAAFGERYWPNQPIAPYTWTKLGGVAEHVVIAQTVQDLMQAARLANQFNRPLAVIGAGSGVLASDFGFPGVLVVNQTDRLMFDAVGSQVTVDSGVSTDRLLTTAASRGLGGLEFLATVPGTIGGAIATGATVGDRSVLPSVRELILFWPTDGGQVVTLDGQQLRSEAYQPLFDRAKAPPVILTVRLQLSSIDQNEILRRLRTARRSRGQLLHGRRLDHVFTEPLAAAGLDHRLLQRLKTNGATVDRRDADSLIRTSDKTQAADVHRLIVAIKQLAAEQGTHLAERLDYLGYWPDEGSTESPASPPDAESLSA